MGRNNLKPRNADKYQKAENLKKKSVIPIIAHDILAPQKELIYILTNIEVEFK
jgi:hypothetical protein